MRGALSWSWVAPSYRHPSCAIVPACLAGVLQALQAVTICFAGFTLGKMLWGVMALATPGKGSLKSAANALWIINSLLQGELLDYVVGLARANQSFKSASECSIGLRARDQNMLVIMDCSHDSLWVHLVLWSSTSWVRFAN